MEAKRETLTPAAAEARKIFTTAIAKATDLDAKADLEIAREYFTNPEFRAAFEELSFKATGG